MADYPNVVLAGESFTLTPDEPLVDILDALVGFPLEVKQEGGAVQSVVNRVWDTVAGAFVRWVTSEIDSAGSSYPGPGTFGVDTSDYIVETIKFTRV